MPREYSAIIIIPRKAKVNYGALLKSSVKYKRSGIAVEDTGHGIKITISASDVTALRAAINSVARDVQVIEGASAACTK